jgi:nitrogenase molybdenum-iron protein alpha/beta subunit
MGREAVRMRNGPDALTGAVLAVEGISDAKAVMHGPTGCRKNMVCFSRRYFTRVASEPKDVFDSFISQSDRVPYSDVSSMDLITGGCAKLAETIGEQPSDETVFVIGAPSTIVNGDPMESAVEKSGRTEGVYILDAPELSGPMCKGFDHALTQAVSLLVRDRREVRKDSVNLLGLNIWTKSWEAVLEELREMLSKIGIIVLCVPGAGSSCAEIASSVDAEMNLIMAPEYCSELSKFYAKFGIRSEQVGIPIGFEGTRKWISEIAGLFGKDPSPVIEDIDRRERSCAADLNAARFGHPLRGSSFCIEGDASLVIPMTEWMYSYLSVIPDAVMLSYGASDEQKAVLAEMLEGMGCSDALTKGPVDCEFYLSDGVDAKHMEAAGLCNKGVAISNPQPIKDFRPAQVIGCGGVLYLLDCLINY